MADLEDYVEHVLLPRLTLKDLLSYSAKKFNVTPAMLADETGRSTEWAKAVIYGRRFPVNFELTKKVAGLLRIQPSFLWCMILRHKYGDEAWTSVEDLVGLQLHRNIRDNFDDNLLSYLENKKRIIPHNQ